MHYMGGKSRIAKQLTEVILEYAESRDVLIEPFMGAANMTAALAPHFDRVYAYDIHEDLILMWRQYSLFKEQFFCPRLNVTVFVESAFNLLLPYCFPV